MEALLNLELLGVPINPKPATGRLGLTLTRRRNRIHRKASSGPVAGHDNAQGAALSSDMRRPSTACRCTI